MNKRELSFLYLFIVLETAIGVSLVAIATKLLLVYLAGSDSFNIAVSQIILSFGVVIFLHILHLRLIKRSLLLPKTLERTLWALQLVSIFYLLCEFVNLPVPNWIILAALVLAPVIALNSILIRRTN